MCEMATPEASLLGVQLRYSGETSAEKGQEPASLSRSGDGSPEMSAMLSFPFERLERPIHREVGIRQRVVPVISVGP